MTFQERLKLHDNIQNYLLYIFEISGYPCEPYGIESGKGLKIHGDLLKCENHTAKYVRHQPDKIIIKDNEAVFIDIKTQKRYDTLNFSIELDSYKTCRQLENNDCEVLYIFNKQKNIPYDLHACHVKDVSFIYVDKNPDWTIKGSRTPFGLISKNAQYIKPITNYFNKLVFPKFIAKTPGQQNLQEITKQIGGIF